MSYPLPGVNSLLAVDVDGHEDLASRVEDIVMDPGGTSLALAAPRYRGDADAPEPGRRVTLRWTSARGLMTVPARISRLERLPLPMWWVQPLTEVTVEQRRRYVRASMAGPVSMCALDLADHGVSGQLLDVGEGGAKVRLASSPGLTAGAGVLLRFALGDDLLAVAATVVRTTSQPVGVHVSLQFGDAGSNGDRIRRHVLHQQILARRSS